MSSLPITDVETSRPPINLRLLEVLSKYMALRDKGEAPLNPAWYSIGGFVTDGAIPGDDKHYGRVATDSNDVVLRDPSQVYVSIVPSETEPDSIRGHRQTENVSLSPIFEEGGKGPRQLWKAKIQFPEGRKFFTASDGADYRERNEALLHNRLVPSKLVIGDLNYGELDPIQRTVDVTLVGTATQARNLEIVARILGRCSQYTVVMEEKPPGAFTSITRLLHHGR